MILLVGSNHLSAPVELREQMAFNNDDLPGALAQLLDYDAVEEAMILSTCNRVEVLVRNGRSEHDGVQALSDFLARHHDLDEKQLERYCYRFVDRDAVRHLFRVASGLDSMILGEPQILGQVKRAYLDAKAARATGPLLERLMQHCLGTAKQVRTETGISRHAVSIAFAAVELARKIFGELKGRRALLLGAGKMSDLVARYLVREGVDHVVVASRTYTRAVEAAGRIGGTAVYWEQGLENLGQADIVISATGATHRILDKKQVAAAMRGRRAAPLFLIDIAVPRDVDPSVHELPRVYLYDIDALQGVIDSNLEERRQAAEKAQQMVAREVAAFERWRRTQDLAPVIVALREQMLEMGKREIERHRRKLGSLEEGQRQAVEELTRAVIQKLLHRPLRHIRQSVERGDVAESVDLYRRLFGLEELPPTPAAATEPDEGGEEDRKTDRGQGPQRLLEGGKRD